jgi:hypothetical protein
MILVESTCRSMFPVENDWQYALHLLCNVSMRQCNGWWQELLVLRKYVLLTFDCVLDSLIVTLQNSGADFVEKIK